MQIWVYIALISGFLGFYTLFLDINIFIKAITIFTFFNCFISVCPLISFKDYPLLVGCVYLYWLLTKLKNWKIVFNLILTLVIFNLFFVGVQIINQDSLLNWGLKNNAVFGTVRNPMQLKSLIIVALAFLIAYKKPKLIRSKWLLSLIMIGAIFYFFYHRVGYTFIHIRLEAWKEAIRIYLLHPFSGWGISSFKFIFPALSHQAAFNKEGTWLQAHNDWLQILFETGLFGFILVSGYMVNLINKIKGLPFLLIGLGLITLDMCVHFPLHMISTVLIIIAFLAYCEREVRSVR